MLSKTIPEIVSEVTKSVSANGTEEKRKIEEVVQDKLRPIQSFAVGLKTEREMSVYLRLSTLSSKDCSNAFAVWQLLDSAPRPMMLKEIASKLNANEYFVSTILFTLIQMGFVFEYPDEGKGKTYSVIPPASKTSGTHISAYRISENKNKT